MGRRPAPDIMPEGLICFPYHAQLISLVLLVFNSLQLNAPRGMAFHSDGSWAQITPAI